MNWTLEDNVDVVTYALIFVCLLTGHWKSNISTYFCVREEVLYIEVLCYVILAPARTVAREDRPGHETWTGLR